MVRCCNTSLPAASSGCDVMPSGKYPCPADVRHGHGDKPAEDRPCGETFQQVRGAAYHAVNKPNEYHAHESSKQAAEDIGESLQGTGGRPSMVDSSNTFEEIETESETMTEEPVKDPEIPAKDESQVNQSTANCPTCGEDLLHSPAELASIINKQGTDIRCAECDQKIAVDNGGVVKK